MKTALSNPGTRLRVRVPASTSNLGPGFDLLGIALSLFLDLEVEVTEGVHRFVERTGTAASWPATDNKFLLAFDAGLRALGGDPLGLDVRAHSEIPVGRGLGSSGAAICAGVALALACHGGGVRDLERLGRVACDLEGHPDNSTASLFGGCTLALPTDGGLVVVQQELHASLGFAVAWPEHSVSTDEARRALPAEVPLADAIENPRRLGILLEGLRTGDAALIGLGIEDRLHVQHRLKLIPRGAAGLAAALEAGAWGATISGSGSSLIALGPKEAMAPIAEQMADALDGEGRVVEPVEGPPHIEELTR